MADVAEAPTTAVDNPPATDNNYRQTVYDNLKQAYGDNFTRTPEEFNKKLDSDPEYAKVVYDNLKQAYGSDFKRTSYDFINLVGGTDTSKVSKDVAPITDEQADKPQPKIGIEKNSFLKAPDYNGMSADMKQMTATGNPMPEIKNALQGAIINHSAAGLKDLGIDLPDLKGKDINPEKQGIEKTFADKLVKDFTDSQQLKDGILDSPNYQAKIADEVAKKYSVPQKDVLDYISKVNDTKKDIRSNLADIALNPQNDKAYAELGNNYYNIGEYDNAGQAYMAALKADPNSEGAKNGLASVVLQKKDYPTAVQLFGELAQANPNTDNISKLATAVYGTGDFAKAHQLADAAVKAGGDMPDAYSLKMRAVTNAALGDNAASIADTKASATAQQMAQDNTIAITNDKGQTEHITQRQQELDNEAKSLNAFVDVAHEVIDKGTNLIPEKIVANAIMQIGGEMSHWNALEAAKGLVEDATNTDSKTEMAGAVAASTLASAARVGFAALTIAVPEVQKFQQQMTIADVVLPSKLLAGVMQPISSLLNSGASEQQKNWAQVADVVASLLIFHKANELGSKGYERAVELGDKIKNNIALTKQDVADIADGFNGITPQTVFAIDHNIAENGGLNLEQKAVGQSLADSHAELGNAGITGEVPNEPFVKPDLSSKVEEPVVSKPTTDTTTPAGEVPIENVGKAVAEPKPAEQIETTSEEVIKKSKLDPNSALADDVKKVGDYVEVEFNPRNLNIAETPDERKSITANSTSELPHVIIDDVIKGQVHILDGSNRIKFARDNNESIKAFVPKERINEFNDVLKKGGYYEQPLEQTQRIDEPFIGTSKEPPIGDKPNSELPQVQGQDIPNKETGAGKEGEKKSQAASQNIDVTTLAKNDEFTSNGEKFKFVGNEPDGRVTVRTSTGSVYTTDAGKFKDATVENNNKNKSNDTGRSTNAGSGTQNDSGTELQKTTVHEQRSGFENNTGGGEQKTFITHNKERVSGKRLSDALNKVADDLAEMSKGIRKEDKYADHVTEKEKDDILAKGLEYAEEVRRGEHSGNLTVWQRVNRELTGEDVPLMPKPSELKSSPTSTTSEADNSNTQSNGKEQTEAQRGQEGNVSSAGDPIRKFANKVRKGKIDKDIMLATVPFGKEIWNGAVEATALAIEGGAKIADAIEAGLKHLRESQAYKDLERDKQKLLEDKFTESHKEPLTEDFHSAQNAVVEAKRKALGLEPVFKELKSTDEKLFNEVADIVSKEGAVDTMVNTAIKSNRFAFTAAEQLAVLRERSQIDEQLTALDIRAINGEDVAAERTVLFDKLNQYDQTLMNIGTVSGQVLRARQFFVDKELNQHIILQRMKADANGKDLPPEVVKQIDDLFKQRDAEKAARVELEKKYEQAQSDLALEREANNLKKAAEQNRREQFKIKKTTRIEEINRNIVSIKEALKRKQKERGGTLNSGGDIKGWLEDAPLLGKLALEHVKLGIEKADELRDAVWNDVKDIYDGITKRDVADAISGYGKKIEPNPDPDIAKLRDLRTQLRLMSGMEDVQGGELPKRSGLQRSEPSPDARILRQELAKAIKDSGLDKDVNADPEKWKSAVAAAEKALENQVHLLDEQIAQEKRIGNTPTSLVPSDKMLELRAERDAKRKALDTILQNNGTITEEKLAANKKLLETRITELSMTIR